MRFSEQITQELQARILKEEVHLGERLPSEIELAKEFQVSRTVIRESMRQLETLGLVRIKKGPKGGIFANDDFDKPLSTSLKGLLEFGQVTPDNIFAIRLLVEPFSTAEAAKWATDMDMSILRSLLEKSEKKFDDVEYLQNNRGKFHVQLAKASGNPILAMFMNSLIEIFREYLVDFKDLKFEQQAVLSHWKILEAIQSRNPEEARRIMEHDILEMQDIYLSYKKKGHHHS
jgi:DNA-binding FadR family transcriptional regulator